MPKLNRTKSKKIEEFLAPEDNANFEDESEEYLVIFSWLLLLPI